MCSHHHSFIWELGIDKLQVVIYMGKWYSVIVMSGMQLGSGQTTVFAMIAKLATPCCHRKWWSFPHLLPYCHVTQLPCWRATSVEVPNITCVICIWADPSPRQSCEQCPGSEDLPPLDVTPKRSLALTCQQAIAPQQEMLCLWHFTQHLTMYM